MGQAGFVVWFAVALGSVAVIVGIVTLRDAVADRRAILCSGIGNGRRLVAERSVQAEIARLAVLVVLTGVGVLIAWTVPRVTPPIVVARLAYLLVQAILAGDGVLALLYRRRLLRMQPPDQ